MAIRSALSRAMEVTRDRNYASDRLNAADVIAEFLSALPLDLKVQFPRALCQHELDQLGPFKAIAEMVRDAVS